MRDYLSPERNRVALLTIDAQRDFCMSSGRGKAGCSAPFTAAMTRLTEGFRAKGRPIVHVVRLYRCDGSNVECVSMRTEHQMLGSQVSASSSVGLMSIIL